MSDAASEVQLPHAKPLRWVRIEALLQKPVHNLDALEVQAVWEAADLLEFN